MSRVFIGIDPGVSGGIAAIDDNGRALGVHNMPATERDLLDVLCLYVNPGTQTRAVLERVSSSPVMGRASAFTFGRMVGQLEMALVALQIPYDRVVPQKWQAALGARTKGIIGVRAADKNITKRRAQALFPSSKVTHAVADALLLAEYCRRQALGGALERRPSSRRKAGT